MSRLQTPKFIIRLRDWIRRHPFVTATALVLVIFYAFCLPKRLFYKPYSTVAESREGELLSARIASDGQWRFPPQDSVPLKFKKCIIAFEDAHFYHHPGFNPFAMAGAARQNWKAGRVVRGGSTITQQVIRLSRSGESRSYLEKVIEVVLATRLEWRHSKEEILELYAAHAPFGGNVVGLDMAAWRYFGVRPYQLSWAESAMLAVLPNAPGLIYPGKNQEQLRRKRNALLRKLHEEGTIDRTTFDLALREPLPQRAFELPHAAPHLLHRIARTQEGSRVQTTIDARLQERVNQIVAGYHNQYRHNGVHNMAVLVVDVKTRNVLAYVGNAPTAKDHQKDVDIIPAPRSTGSILKPLLYASMLDAGELLPQSLVPDVPTQIAGYTPQNYELTYDGAVPAQRALARSLNIPSVLMLRDYGVQRFYDRLQRLHLRDIKRHPNHYGLSLILGGAESNLWDLCRAYAGLTGTLEYFKTHDARYRSGEFADLNWDSQREVSFGRSQYNKEVFGAGSIWLTYNAMREVNRPEGDEAWKFYDSSLQIAWKTGTSFGNRDAWAIGTSSRYVVGVWVGNATGEGRPSLTGVESAAPVMFDVFNLLPRAGWFSAPLGDLEEVDVCKVSGYVANEHCESVKQWVPNKSSKTTPCPYHQLIYVNSAGERVNSSCSDVSAMRPVVWFSLPPVMEWYYKSRHLDYSPLPRYAAGCSGGSHGSMDFIYPKESGKVYLTKDFSGRVQPVICKVAHTQPDARLYWYLGRKYLGETHHFHEMQISAETGAYWLTVVDQHGQELVRKIEIVREP